ncbi:MAG: hypothetical protein U0610_00620 [bacterium]
MTERELHRQEILVRLPHAFLAVLALAGAALLARTFDPALHAAPLLAVSESLPNLPSRLLLPAVAPLALELVLGAAVALVGGRRSSLTRRLERRAEHLEPAPAAETASRVLARVTTLGFDGTIEHPPEKTVIAIVRPRTRPFRGFAGLPLVGSITIEEIAGVSHVSVTLAAATFIVRETGEGLYLGELAAYLAGHGERVRPIRAPAAGMSFAVGYAALAVALTAVAARGGWLVPALYAEMATTLGLVTSALALIAIGLEWRASLGLPETLAALVATILTRITLAGWHPPS